MGSRNKVIIGQLVETLKTKETNLYNALKRIQEDLSTTYDTLFDGPLPAVSAENLDFSKSNLTDVISRQLPPTVAFTNFENIFIQDQVIEKNNPTLTLLGDNGNAFINLTKDNTTLPAGLSLIGDGKLLVGGGLKWDGANIVTINPTSAGILLNEAIPIDLFAFIASVKTSCLRVEVGGQVTVSKLNTLTDLVFGDLGLENGGTLRGTNFAGTHNHPMIKVDADDLVQLGSNPTGFTTGEGNPAIPTAVTADLPVAGANRNGLIIINKTVPRICFYTGGLRYFVNGTAF